MTDQVHSDHTPIFVIGCRWSGASAITGLLHKAGGMALGDLAPPTPDNPSGRFEAAGIVEAHRGILKQMDRDWTCPPPDFDPSSIDLSHLQEQAAIHRRLPGPWGVKDPQLMFVLRAWEAVGVHSVRFVGVLRPEADLIQSLVHREGMGQLEAESIVATYLHRMSEIAAQTAFPIIEFSSDTASVVDQTRKVASSLELGWDEGAAAGFFEPSLVHHEVRMDDHTDEYLALVDRSNLDASAPTCNLGSLRFESRFPESLNGFIGPRNIERRNELWRFATFDLLVTPHILELIPRGSQEGTVSRPGVELDVVELDRPLHVGVALRESDPANGVIASGLLDAMTEQDLETFLAEIHLFTDDLAEAVFDITEPDEGVPVVRAEADGPSLQRQELIDAINATGWAVVLERRVSPHRVAFKLRKRIAADLAASGDISEVATTVEYLRNLERTLGVEASRLLELQEALAQDGIASPVDAGYVASLIQRATSAERDLARLKNRRSVRFSLYMARPFKGVFRSIRRWR